MERQGREREREGERGGESVREHAREKETERARQRDSEKTHTSSMVNARAEVGSVTHGSVSGFGIVKGRVCPCVRRVSVRLNGCHLIFTNNVSSTCVLQRAAVCRNMSHCMALCYIVFSRSHKLNALLTCRELFL